MNTIPGMWPGTVVSYDPESRQCRVSIEGLTDGAATLPNAIIMPPIGDRADAAEEKDHTELRILPGDDVWLMFEQGNPRYPIIMGHRLKRTGNPDKWRRWRHENIETTADKTHIVNAEDIIFRIGNSVTWEVGGDVVATIGGKQKTDVAGLMESAAANSTHQALTHLLTAQTTITGGVLTQPGLTGGAANSGFVMRGDLWVQEGSVQFTDVSSITHEGVRIDNTHTHPENNDDGGNTDPPSN